MNNRAKERPKVLKMFLQSAICNLIICLVSLTNAAGYDFGRNSPLQMDVTAGKAITICTGMKRAIACRDGSNIAITHAFWGRVSDKVCPSDDGDPVTDCEGAEETIDLVRSYCEGKPGCTLQARHQYLQKNGTHHCPGVNKYLVVNYTCIPDSKGVVLCDSEESLLECKAGWRIDITDAFWGRRANSKYCPTGMQEMECDNGPSAKANLKKKCDGQSSCIVKATSDELEDKKTVCPGNLLYLLLNYACRSSSTKGAKTIDVDDDVDATVENKLLADTSSKELMGLLEKHLNELQTKPAQNSNNKKGALDSDDEKEKEKETKSTNKKASGSSSSKSKSSAKKAVKTDEKATAELVPQPASTTAGFIRSIPSGTEQKETPAMDMKETDASKKMQETVPAAATGEKKQILPKASIETPVDEPSYEVSEPNTVKSILARAKEVLKSLDDEKEESNEESKNEAGEAKKSAKKSDIVRKDEGTINEDDADAQKQAKSVKQVVKLAANLVKTANKYKDSKIKSKNAKTQAGSSAGEKGLNASQFKNEKKPKPGPKKSGLSATGPGRAGMGNTP
ncbi:uncharacterized protein LOC135683777 [Rhopilema esculentum]|uniref:uncharacterized protein LOC135683777 n=1 Tax=Rhopilema esculentum TaxID=499914 RepID=UPI0031D12E17|eukprot:gene15876-7207_t